MSEIARIARWYDILFPARPDQVAWLVHARPAPAPRIACDLGCGTALHLEALRERGLEVFGLDREAGMIEVARERCPTLGERLHVGEMARADEVLTPHLRGQGAGLVFSLGNALSSLADDEELRRTLEAVRRLKHEDGAFAVQVINHDRLRAQGFGEFPVLTRPIPGGESVLRFHRRLEESAPGRLAMITRLETPEGEIEGRSELLELRAERLEAALHATGFAERTWFGDYDGSPWSPEAPATMVITR